MADRKWLIRPFIADDLPGIIGVLLEACPREEISQERFAQHILLDEGFHREGLLVAIEETTGEVMGVCYAVLAGPHRVPLPWGTGWITLLAVGPTHRRQGVGGALVDTAIAWLEARGAERVDFCAYPPGYFVPGLDAETYPDAMTLLASKGFEVRITSVGQSAPISDTIPDSIAKLKQQRLEEGYAIEPAGWGDLPELIQWAAEKVAPDWGDIVREESRRRARPDRIVLCRDPQGAVVGFSTFASYDGDIGRFGPIGVDPSQRGKALGAILLAETMAQQAREGASESYFLWGETHGPAFTMYERAGWRVNRTFQLLRKDL